MLTGPMKFVEGGYAFIPTELTFGTVSSSLYYDAQSGDYVPMYRIDDGRQTREIPAADAERRGLRAPVPMSVVDLMLAVVSSRVGEMKGGRFNVRNRPVVSSDKGVSAGVYYWMLVEEPIFGPALVLRDLVERYRRSAKKRRRKLIGRISLTDEDALRKRLATYIAASYAAAKHAQTGRGKAENYLAEGLERVEEAMAQGTPNTIAVY
jgi:hypothetical protein